MTLKNLLTLYFKHRLIRPATVICYQDAVISLERFTIETQESTTRLSDLTVDRLLNYRQWCLTRMRPTSFNKHRRHLRALLNFSVAQALIDRSPLLQVSPAPTGQRRPKTVDRRWYKKSIALLSGDSDTSVRGLAPAWFWRTLLGVMHFTGMRRRQVIELQWQHVNLTNHSLLLASEGSKSRKEWVVPIPKWLAGLLRDLKVRAGTQLCGQPEPTDQVFCLPLHSRNPSRFKSSRMNETHLSKGFLSLSKHLGYTISAHRVRHTSATVMLAGSNNLKAVCDFLGHSDINLTANTYVHPSLATLRRAQRKMPEYESD